MCLTVYSVWCLFTRKKEKKMLWKFWTTFLWSYYGKRSRCAFGNVFHNMIDSIAASLFENDWLSWQIVPDDKIQISLLLLWRGALSKYEYSFHWRKSLFCWTVPHSLSPGSVSCKIFSCPTRWNLYFTTKTSKKYCTALNASCKMTRGLQTVLGNLKVNHSHCTEKLYLYTLRLVCAMK